MRPRYKNFLNFKTYYNIFQKKIYIPNKYLLDI